MRGRGRWTARGIAVLAGLVLAGRAEADSVRFRDQTGATHCTTGPPQSEPAARSGATRLPRVQGRAVGAYANLIRATSERYQMDTRLVEAVVAVESAGNPRAVSRKGAQGLMQLMPGRSVELGVRDPFDPAQNVDGGVRHLRDLLRRFRGNVSLALAAYNAGEDAVRTHGDIPPYPETQEYVRRVRALYDAREPSAPASPAGQAPQQVYRLESTDGAVLYTNIPPAPGPFWRGKS